MWDFLEGLPKPVVRVVLAALGGGILGGVLATRLGREDLAPMAAIAGFFATGAVAALIVFLWYRRRGGGPSA